jgi:hypothetical protein
MSQREGRASKLGPVNDSGLLQEAHQIATWSEKQRNDFAALTSSADRFASVASLDFPSDVPLEQILLRFALFHVKGEAET